MKLSYLMIAAAGSALLAGSAMAQDQAAPTPMTPDQAAAAPAADQPAAPAVNDPSAMPPPAADQSTMPPAAQYNYNANPGATTAPASSSTLGDPTTMKAGDTAVVSNGPVPDTAENRAKYGKPMSNAGKKSKPAGN